MKPWEKEFWLSLSMVVFSPILAGLLSIFGEPGLATIFIFITFLSVIVFVDILHGYSWCKK